ncbi:hypothetical protein Sango_2895500 [Sesamum angolense]|uniref:Reverse transcriptase domain-containing protein n=1 Tax=Sesamum angolense TaxID=2727404 RepID=A0AAE1T5G2_9LAMI|nr:hypothetical protein Sango_2895500 [Sesamum angolense]
MFATSLALIPKVQTPTTVADFRPISCCNVLYKAITKIIDQRLCPLLDRLLSFADDLLMFSIADETLVGLFKQGLHIFASLPGLCSNPENRVIRHIEKMMRIFLWKGTSDTCYAKVTRTHVCLPLEEGEQGVYDLQALNYALMSEHLCSIISRDLSSISVTWIHQYWLQEKSI